MPLKEIRKNRHVKIMHKNRLATNRGRKSYQFVKQQKPITFNLELKLTGRIFSNFFFFFFSLE